MHRDNGNGIASLTVSEQSLLAPGGKNIHLPTLEKETSFTL